MRPAARAGAASGWRRHYSVNRSCRSGSAERQPDQSVGQAHGKKNATMQMRAYQQRCGSCCQVASRIAARFGTIGVTAARSRTGKGPAQRRDPREERAGSSTPRPAQAESAERDRWCTDQDTKQRVQVFTRVRRSGGAGQIVRRMPRGARWPPSARSRGQPGAAGTSNDERKRTVPGPRCAAEWPALERSATLGSAERIAS